MAITPNLRSRVARLEAQAAKKRSADGYMKMRDAVKRAASKARDILQAAIDEREASGAPTYPPSNNWAGSPREKLNAAVAEHEAIRRALPPDATEGDIVAEMWRRHDAAAAEDGPWLDRPASNAGDDPGMRGLPATGDKGS